MINFIKRLILKYGFGRKAQAGVSPELLTQMRNHRLAAIARERNALKVRLDKAVKQKKARAPIYAALRALSVEELRLEQGK